ncbi:hypothetical protein TcYC6_0031710 [Trypanosoma cruzi]|nr:hypothetical protein TcYC6_0031710 [Trypanosoma cruzi]
MLQNGDSTDRGRWVGLVASRRQGPEVRYNALRDGCTHHDTATLRKCRLFVGWAHLWNGDVRQAVEIFEQQLVEARVEGDAVQERRCISAIHHARHNPSVVVACGARGQGSFFLSECWAELFE